AGGEEVANFIARELRVERERDAASVEDAQVGDQERKLLRSPEDDAISLFHPGLLQKSSAVTHQAVEVCVGAGAAAVDESRLAGPLLESRAEFVQEMGTHRSAALAGWCGLRRLGDGRYHPGSR